MIMRKHFAINNVRYSCRSVDSENYKSKNVKYISITRKEDRKSSFYLWKKGFEHPYCDSKGNELLFPIDAVLEAYKLIYKDEIEEWMDGYLPGNIIGVGEDIYAKKPKVTPQPPIVENSTNNTVSFIKVFNLENNSISYFSNDSEAINFSIGKTVSISRVNLTELVGGVSQSNCNIANVSEESNINIETNCLTFEAEEINTDSDKNIVIGANGIARYEYDEEESESSEEDTDEEDTDEEDTDEEDTDEEDTDEEDTENAKTRNRARNRNRNRARNRARNRVASTFEEDDNIEEEESFEDNDIMYFDLEE